jgi:hypothetical protein
MIAMFESPKYVPWTTGYCELTTTTTIIIIIIIIIIVAVTSPY